MKDEKELGLRLKGIQEALQINGREFAKRLGISSPSLSEIQNGKYRPNYDCILTLAKEFNVNLYYIFFGVGEMFGNTLPPTFGNGCIISQSQMKEFLYYFERSEQVQLLLYAAFKSILLKEQETIKADMEAYERKFMK